MLYDVDDRFSGPGEFVDVRVHEFKKSTAAGFEDQLETAYAQDQKVVPVTIDSNGGDIHSALSMLETIRAFPGTVLTYVKGRAKSAALALTCFGTTGYRYAAPTSYLMFHQANMGLGRNKMRSLKSTLKYGEALQEVMLREMARECGFEDDHFEKLIDERGNINFYMNPKEAKSRGFVDHIARPKLDVRADGSFEVTTS